ncbi:hypothetical protein HMPREF0372_03312 [Flavonifractor plautii ATCC 29863]|uniref:Uncharacterized protein n=1 Tax=Flavonifractor plautii ATCC 29863 TaxID=411475 RepID=G9YUU0_FLAPL|nr:hypothetical protein HMPREF0372_03312 [Flavonifractor plautii ATCC 29863]
MEIRQYGIGGENFTWNNILHPLRLSIPIYFHANDCNRFLVNGKLFHSGLGLFGMTG